MEKAQSEVPEHFKARASEGNMCGPVSVAIVIHEGILAKIYMVVRWGPKIIDHGGLVADIVAFSKFGSKIVDFPGVI